MAFHLRQFPGNPIDPQLRRIFKLGHRVEDIVIEDVLDAIREKGWEVEFFPTDPKTGKQFHFEDYEGFLVAHPDGMFVFADEQKMLAEIKSMNADKWTECNEVGVQKSHPKYYAQMQTQMHIAEINATLFISYNKNTSEYLLQTVEYDPLVANALMARVELVLANQARKARTEKGGICHWCPMSGACWDGVIGKIACSNCAHSEARPGGWWCHKHRAAATSPCPQHQVYRPLPKTGSA